MSRNVHAVKNLLNQLWQLGKSFTGLHYSKNKNQEPLVLAPLYLYNNSGSLPHKNNYTMRTGLQSSSATFRSNIFRYVALLFVSMMSLSFATQAIGQTASISTDL